MFVEKLNDMREQDLDEVTLKAEAAFVDIQWQMLTKDTKAVTPKCSLQLQTKGIFVSDNSK